jgi:hypothetical protein
MAEIGQFRDISRSKPNISFARAVERSSAVEGNHVERYARSAIQFDSV